MLSVNTSALTCAVCQYLRSIAHIGRGTAPWPCLAVCNHSVHDQVDILEHKETQLKGTERRVHSLQQQVETQQAELSRSASVLLSCRLLMKLVSLVLQLC